MDGEGGERIFSLSRNYHEGGKGNDQDQLVTRKAGGGDVAEAGESIMDFLGQSASCDLFMGKPDTGQFQIASAWKFLSSGLS